MGCVWQRPQPSAKRKRSLSVFVWAIFFVTMRMMGSQGSWGFECNGPIASIIMELGEDSG